MESNSQEPTFSQKDVDLPEPSVHFTFTTRRKGDLGLEECFELQRAYLVRHFNAQEIHFSIQCDVCSKDGLTKEDVKSSLCSSCESVYDYCKTHKTRKSCPFCSQPV